MPSTKCSSLASSSLTVSGGHTSGAIPSSSTSFPFSRDGFDVGATVPGVLS